MAKKKPKVERKVGKWTRKEKEFMLQNSDKMTVDEISEAIGRNPRAIRTYINGNLTLRRPEAALSALHAEYEIQKTPVWKELQDQFSAHELDMFIYHWKRILGQFKDDVFPTEELQIVDTIKAEILMSRILSQKNRNDAKIRDLEDQIQLENNLEGPDLVKIANLERQKNFLESAQSSISKEYTDMAKRKDDLMKQMKATRDQRIKNLESSRNNIVEWMKDVLQDVDKRTRLGREMEKLRLATDVEVQRISDYITYEDLIPDRPFLIPELLEKEEIVDE
jgi:predicted transcriptional regulator